MTHKNPSYSSHYSTFITLTVINYRHPGRWRFGRRFFSLSGVLLCNRLLFCKHYLCYKKGHQMVRKWPIAAILWIVLGYFIRINEFCYKLTRSEPVEIWKFDRQCVSGVQHKHQFEYMSQEYNRWVTECHVHCQPEWIHYLNQINIFETLTKYYLEISNDN